MSKHKVGDKVVFGHDKEPLDVLAVRGSYLWVAKPRPVHERTATDDDYYGPFTVDATLVKKYAPFFEKDCVYRCEGRFSIFVQKITPQTFHVIHVSQNSDNSLVAYGKLSWPGEEQKGELIRKHWRYTTFNQYDYDAGGWTRG